MRLFPLLPARTGAGADPAAGVWLITFTDLIGLMLAFFIMMYAMSKLDEERWGKLVPHLAPVAPAEEPAVPGSAVPPASATASTEVPAPARGRSTDYLAVLLPQKLAAMPALAEARVLPGASRVDLVLPRAALDGPHAGAAAALAGLLGSLPNAARIEATIDGRAHRPQDWAEATRRAAAVAAALAAAGYSRPLEARGHVGLTDGAAADTIAIVILE
jgi:chemotaxis protein MotB